MKRILIVLLVFAGSFAAAQTIAPFTTSEAAGFSAERAKRIDREMNTWVQNGWIPGCVALVIHNGKTAYYQAAGFKNLDTKSIMQKDDIFRIASQTKAITSVAIMILHEEGKLLLDDPVSKYIPAFNKQQVLDKFNADDTSYTTVPAKKNITIRELLTHSSGLGYAQIGTREANAIYAKSNLTAGIGVTNDNLLDAMNRLAKLPLMHQPGEKWTYGLNTDLLGCLVEVISGKSLDEFFSTRIFEPLGMHDTYFNIPAQKASRLVGLYKQDSTGNLVKAPDRMLNGPVGADYPITGTAYFSGGAGLSSTIYDYAVFLQMLLNDGVYNGKRILGRNSVRLMTMNQIGDLAYGDNKFGLGFQIVTEKGSAKTQSQAGTFGWGGAFQTSYWVDPVEKLVILFYRQMQGASKGDVQEKFRTLVYQALKD